MLSTGHAPLSTDCVGTTPVGTGSAVTVAVDVGPAAGRLAVAVTVGAAVAVDDGLGWEVGAAVAVASCVGADAGAVTCCRWSRVPP